MATAGVSRAILVPPSWEGYRNDLSLRAARRFPNRFAVMGRLDLRRPQGRARLEVWRKQRGMLGVRLTFHRESERGWLSDGTADWFWKAAEAAQLPVMVFVPGQLRALNGVASAYPDLKLIVDHLGLGVTAQSTDIPGVVADLLPLARHANVAVKASALPCHASDIYPFHSLHDHIQQVVLSFGPQRVMWGSDLTRLPCSYRQAISLFTEELPFLATDDLEWIMWRSASTWLNWPVADWRRSESRENTTAPLWSNAKRGPEN